MKIALSTEVIAWWGAIVATVVLIWDIYKWRHSGAKTRMKVRSNRKVMGVGGREDETLIVVDAVNIGNLPTTLTGVGLAYYKSFSQRIRRKHHRYYSILYPILTQALPYALEPGKIWKGAITQDQSIEQMPNNGYLICLLFDSCHKKPSAKRITVKDLTTQSTGPNPSASRPPS